MKRLALLLALLPSVAQAQTTEFYLKFTVAPSGVVTTTLYTPPPVVPPPPFTAGWVQIQPTATTIFSLGTYIICRRTEVGNTALMLINPAVSPTCAPRVP